MAPGAWILLREPTFSPTPLKVPDTLPRGSALRTAAVALALLALGSCASSTPAPAGEPASVATAGRLYVPNQSVATISVIDLGTDEILEVVDLRTLGFDGNARPHHVAVEPDGSFWYVSLIGANQVLKFDSDNNLVGSAPFEVPGIVAVHPTEDWLFVGRSMAAVDPPERIGRIQRSTMEIEEWDVFIPHPHALGIGTEGRVYVGSMGENTIAVVDAESGEVELNRFGSGRAHVLVQLAVSADGRMVAATGQLSGQIVAFTTDGPRITLVAEVDVGREPFDPSFTLDGSEVWVGALRDNHVAVVDTDSWQVTDVITDAAISQPHGSAVSADGRTVYIGSRNESGAYTAERDFGFGLPSGTVVAIDQATHEVLDVIETPPYAAGLGITGSGTSGSGAEVTGNDGGAGVAFAALLSGSASQGGWVQELAPFPVADTSGRAYDVPFLGGFNAPRPQLVDIDGDGDLDLFVQEESGRLLFFENVGTPDDPRHLLRPDAFSDLDVGEWYRFVDVDGDGDADLLAEQPFSYVQVFANTGTLGDDALPTFTPVIDTIRDSRGEPLFSDRQNIPNAADLDCDGTLDLLVGRLTGHITHYEATGELSRGSAPFQQIDDRFQDIEIIADPAVPGGGAPAQPAPSGILGSLPRVDNGGLPIARRHGANTMALADIEGDGDIDLFWGDFFEPGLLFIENTGSCASPNLRSAPLPFPVDDPVRTSGYNAPTFGDLDGDGDLDLMMGVLGGAYDPNTTTADNLLFLRQRDDAGFDVETRRFVSQIDVGSESIPSLVDLDGDGDLDLLLANRIDPAEVETAQVYLFENVGNTSAPSYRESGELAIEGAYHNAPAFGDLDGDGDLDLVLGTWRSDLAYFENTGSRADPVFTRADAPVAALPRGSNATPTLGDLDGDGDLDLIVGESDGTLTFFENTGSTSAPRFELTTEAYLDVDTGRRSFPALVDFDGDGDLDLALGSEDTGIAYYENRGDSGDADFQLSAGAFPEASDLPRFVAPAFGDLDGDGQLEMLTGGIGGGAQYFDRP